MTDVALVDPQRLIRAGLSLILQAQPDFKVVGEAETGDEAIEVVSRSAPDVVCIAARMDPSGVGSATGDGAGTADRALAPDGFSVTRRIRALDGIRQPRVVILVGSKDGDVSDDAEAAGADAVVAKYATPESIVMAMRAVLLAR